MPSYFIVITKTAKVAGELVVSYDLFENDGASGVLRDSSAFPVAWPEAGTRLEKIAAVKAAVQAGAASAIAAFSSAFLGPEEAEVALVGLRIPPAA